jgi:transposase
MRRFVGLDVHKQFIEVCVLDRKGKVLSRCRVGCQREEVLEFAQKTLQKTDHVALEATTNTWPIVEILRPHVARVVVGNPLKTKAIAEAKVKTDKIDALVLAQLLRCDYLPEVWQPDSATQNQRSLITHRTGLSVERARHKNRIQCILNRLMLKAPCRCLWTKAGYAWLASLELPTTDRLMLDSELRRLRHVEAELVDLDKALVEVASQESRVQLLMTLPGVSYVVAIGILSALGDITRFRDGDHAASYLGLVPKTRQSANKCFHGRITKAGSPQVRWLLTQACQHVARHPGPLGAFFRRLARRKPRHVALLALARKVVTVAYLMLKHQEPYRYARPDLVAKKLGELRGTAKMATTPGRRSTPQGLAAVYQAVGLPPICPPDQLPDGERRMLADYNLSGYVEGLHQPLPAKARPKTVVNR